MKESDGLSLLVTNVRSLKKQNTIPKTKTQKQKYLAENSLKPEDISKVGNESNRLGHEPIELGTKKYGCSFCSKTMPQASAMKVHILIHTGARPFSCSECGKTFTQKGSLKYHSKTIHARKNVLIKIKAQRQPSREAKKAANRNIAENTGDLFSCSKCDKTFTKKNHLMHQILLKKETKPRMSP